MLVAKHMHVVTCQLQWSSTPSIAATEREGEAVTCSARQKLVDVVHLCRGRNSDQLSQLTQSFIKLVGIDDIKGLS